MLVFQDTGSPTRPPTVSGWLGRCERDHRHPQPSWLDCLFNALPFVTSTRLTNGFSKKLENLKAALALHFAHYNFPGSSYTESHTRHGGGGRNPYLGMGRIVTRRRDMNLLSIPCKKVIAVLLPDGQWRNINEGSFEIGELAYTDADGTILGTAEEAVSPRSGASWREGRFGEQYSCPITSIFAVRHKD